MQGVDTLSGHYHGAVSPQYDGGGGEKNYCGCSEVASPNDIYSLLVSCVSGREHLVVLCWSNSQEFQEVFFHFQVKARQSVRKKHTENYSES